MFNICIFVLECSTFLQVLSQKKYLFDKTSNDTCFVFHIIGCFVKIISILQRQMLDLSLKDGNDHMAVGQCIDSSVSIDNIVSTEMLQCQYICIRIGVQRYLMRVKM